MNHDKKEFLVNSIAVSLDGRTLLEPVSLMLPRGQWLSVIGPNGAGKSTLLKALAGIIESQSDGVRWGALRMDTLSQRERASYLAYVPQRFEALQPFSVEQFLSLALYARGPSEGEGRIEKATRLFRLQHFSQRSIQTLSVGELQRVLLAAAFVQGSELLLLDEPSSALDPHEEVQMVEILRRLIAEEKRTVIFVSHNLSAALSFSDQVLLLDAGRQQFQGAPKELLAGDLLKRVFNQSFFIDRRGQQISVFPDYESISDQP